MSVDCCTCMPVRNLWHESHSEFLAAAKPTTVKEVNFLTLLLVCIANGHYFSSSSATVLYPWHWRENEIPYFVVTTLQKIMTIY